MATTEVWQVDLMLSEAQLGMQDECEAIIRELSAMEVRNADLRVDVARALTLLAAASTAPEARQSRQDRAIAELRRAVTGGLSDPWIIETQADFQGLKGTPEFANILSSIATPKDTPQQ